MKVFIYIFLLAQIIFVILIYLFSRGKYSDELTCTPGYYLRFRALIPIGLQMLALTGHRRRTAYENRIEKKLRMYYGARFSDACLSVHLAVKLLLCLFALIFMTFAASQVKLDMAFLFFCILLSASILYASDKQLDIAVKERSRAIQMEFPKFLNKLVLLIGAGMPLSGAVRKIALEGETSHPLYIELSSAVNEIESGKSETAAYENLAARCRLHEVTAFVSILIQNLRRGNDEIIPLLRLMAGNCWETRRNIAKKLGEEASTKLLFPMAMVFAAILVMLVAPALMQLKL